MQLLSNYLMGIYNDEVQQIKNMDKERSQLRVSCSRKLNLSKHNRFIFFGRVNRYKR